MSGVAPMFALVVVQRLSELWLARRNRRWLLSQGAVEHAGGHFFLFVILHTAWLVAWPTEALLRGELSPRWPLWLGVFVGAEALRYWAIATLGRRWNTRVLVLPGAPRITGGPYRFVPHPNYVAVALELAAVPALFGAWWSAGIFTVLNAGVLLGVRIPAEARALAAADAGEGASVGADREDQTRR